MYIRSISYITKWQVRILVLGVFSLVPLLIHGPLDHWTLIRLTFTPFPSAFFPHRTYTYVTYVYSLS